MGKGQRGVLLALDQIRQRLPFTLAGIHTDNGSEFLNAHLIRYLQDPPHRLHPGPTQLQERQPPRGAEERQPRPPLRRLPPLRHSRAHSCGSRTSTTTSALRQPVPTGHEAGRPRRGRWPHPQARYDRPATPSAGSLPRASPAQISWPSHSVSMPSSARSPSSATSTATSPLFPSFSGPPPVPGRDYRRRSVMVRIGSDGTARTRSASRFDGLRARSKQSGISCAGGGWEWTKALAC